MDTIKQRIQMANGSIVYRTYNILQIIGKGGCAQCFEVQRQQDSKKFALKVIPKSLMLKSEKRSKIIKQLQLHRSLKHKGICQFYDYFEEKDNIYMVLELCTYGSFYDLLQVRGRLSVPQCQFYISQLLDVISYLHKHEIIHRDIKPGNLLLCKGMNLKISDFGMSTKLMFQGDRKHSVCGTPNFIAPQVIQHALQVPLSISGHSFEVDLWSIGVILYTFLIGVTPFQCATKEQTYKKVSRAQYEFPFWFYEKDAKDLISRLLVADPRKRYTIKQVKAHPFMNPKEGIPKFIPQTGLNRVPQIKRQSSGFLGIRLGNKENPQNEINSIKNEDTNSNLSSTFKRNLVQDLTINKTVKKPGFYGVKSDPGDLKLEYQDSSSNSGMKNLLNNFRRHNQQAKNKIFKMKRSHGPFTNAGVEKTQIYIQQKNFVEDIASLNSCRSYQAFTSNISSVSYQQNIQQKKLLLNYVLDVKRQQIWSYIMSSGYICTYETNESGYCVLYNTKDRIFFEIEQGQNPKKTTQQYAKVNEQITQRIPYLKKLEKQYPNIQCQTYDPMKMQVQPIVYVLKAYDIRNQNLILFRLSNNSFQLFNYQTQTILLMIKKNICLINIQNGIQKLLISCDVFAAAQHHNKVLRKMYTIMKKILAKIQQIV